MWWIIGYLIVGFILSIVFFIVLKKQGYESEDALGNPIATMIIWPLLLLAMIPPLLESLYDKIYEFFS